MSDRTLFTIEFADPDVIWLLSNFLQTHDGYELIELEDGTFCYFRI